MAQSHPEGARKRQNVLAKETFKRDPTGKWQLDLEKPFFKEAQIQFKKDSKKDGQTAKPVLVWAQMFGGGPLS
jgi:hypothetical protein